MPAKKTESVTEKKVTTKATTAKKVVPNKDNEISLFEELFKFYSKGAAASLCRNHQAQQLIGHCSPFFVQALSPQSEGAVRIRCHAPHTPSPGDKQYQVSKKKTKTELSLTAV